jgi:FkbM family methyltransferase
MLKHTVQRLVQLDRRVRNQFLLDANAEDLIRLGSGEGGWWLPTRMLRSSSIAVCAGAGEDITFDISLVERGLTVYTVDPTPRAVAHVAAVLESLQQESARLVKGLNYRDYARASFQEDRFKFVPIGLWSTREQLKFFAPRNPSYVSHSVVNLQRTKDYFLAECCPLRDLMETMNIERVDILKLDIEGAEHAVLDQMISDHIFPGCLLVEFDEGQYVDRFDRKKFMTTITLLKRQRYNLIKTAKWNFTFVRI